MKLFNFFKRKPQLTEVEKRNIAFTTATPAEKRVIIAQDALDQITAGRFTAGINYGELAYPQVLSEVKDRQLNEFIQTNPNVRCEGCAKTALFMSHVMRENHVTVGAFSSIGNEGICKYLDGVFDLKQLDMIEAAYERSVMFVTNFTISSKEYATAMEFGCRYKSRQERLVAILRNIIANKGTFDPTK